MPSGRQANTPNMSPSRSATTVTSAADVIRRTHFRMPSIQHWLCLSRKARFPGSPSPPPQHSISCTSISQGSAPCADSTAIAERPKWLSPEPSSRELVVSWIANMGGHRHRRTKPGQAMRVRQSSRPSPFQLRRDRLIRTSPALFPPSTQSRIVPDQQKKSAQGTWKFLPVHDEFVRVPTRPHKGVTDASESPHPAQGTHASPGSAMRYPTPRSLWIQTGLAALSPSLRRRLRTKMRTRFASAPLRPFQTRRSSLS